jgi:pimeloyl-ACP methyl ester carboxylesterase
VTTLVLVHPAWLGGWCWRKLVPLLRVHGHEVHTPTLTGLGERAHLAHPGIDLHVHVTDIVNVLVYEDLHGVVLLGTSSAGMVITGVAEQVPERIGHLVYLDAFVPDDGQSLLDLVPADRRAAMEAQVESEGDGWLLSRFAAAPWDQFVPQAWQVTDPADLVWMLARLRPTPFGQFTTGVRRGNPAARTASPDLHPLHPLATRRVRPTRAGRGTNHRMAAPPARRLPPALHHQPRTTRGHAARTRRGRARPEPARQQLISLAG